MNTCRKSIIQALFLCAVLSAVMPSAVKAAPENIAAGFFGLWGLGDFDLGLKLLKDNGFRLAVLGASKTELDKAEQYGIKAVVSFDLKMGTALDEGKWTQYILNITKMIKMFKDHPAVYAWYPVDEPELQKIPVEKIKIITELIKRLDPGHPVITVMTSAANWGEYLPYFDVIAVDKYLTRSKIGVTSSTNVVRSAIRRLKIDLKNKGLSKPLWVVLGAFETNPRAIGGQSNFHKPTPKEFNEMLDIALQEGAEVILVYTLAFKKHTVYEDWNLPKDDPVLWETVRKMPSMINSMMSFTRPSR